MLASRDKLKGSLYTFVKNINLRKNRYDISIKLSPYYDRSKLFWRKTLVNLQKKHFRKKVQIFQQQFTEPCYYTLFFSSLPVCVFMSHFISKLIFGNAPTLKLPQKKSLLTKKFFCAIILKILQGIIIASTQYHFQINLCGNKQIKKETVKKKIEKLVLNLTSYYLWC